MKTKKSEPKQLNKIMGKDNDKPDSMDPDEIGNIEETVKYKKTVRRLNEVNLGRVAGGVLKYGLGGAAAIGAGYGASKLRNPFKTEEMRRNAYIKNLQNIVDEYNLTRNPDLLAQASVAREKLNSIQSDMAKPGIFSKSTTGSMMPQGDSFFKRLIGQGDTAAVEKSYKDAMEKAGTLTPQGLAAIEAKANADKTDELNKFINTNRQLRSIDPSMPEITASPEEILQYQKQIKALSDAGLLGKVSFKNQPRLTNQPQTPQPQRMIPQQIVPNPNYGNQGVDNYYSRQPQSYYKPRRSNFIQHADGTYEAF